MSFFTSRVGSSADYQRIRTSFDLYPQEMNRAVDRRLDEIEFCPHVPEYGPNMANLLSVHRDNLTSWPDIPKGPLIQQGLDKKERPFLIVFVPDFDPLIYYPYSNTRNLTKLSEWVVGTWTTHEICDKDLLLLTKIMRGEDCIEARRAIPESRY